MDFIKNLFKDEEKIIGLCGFKDFKPKSMGAYLPKFSPSTPTYKLNYEKNFFLL